MEYKYRKEKSDLIGYDTVIIVAGSRSFNDYQLFCERLEMWLSENDYFHGYEIIFVSGMCHSGADNLIIRWCVENAVPWVGIPADWEKYNKRAGYIRNREMAECATHLVAFYDAHSKGTKDMIQQANDVGLVTHVILVDPS